MAHFEVTNADEVIMPDVVDGGAGSDSQQSILRIPALLRRVTGVTRFPTAEILP